MSGKGDQRMSAGVLAALRKGPLDVLDLLTRLRKVGGTALEAQEGHLHGLLHHLLRRKELALEGRSSRGLVRYALADEDEAASQMVPEPPRASVAGDLPASSAAWRAQAAARIARGVRDASQRARVAADVLAHLEQLETSGKAAAFGSVRTSRHYVRRADRGKSTVFFTATTGDGIRRFLLHEGPWLLGAVVVFLVVRAFLAEVFVIPTPSMVPTLLPGDRVAVWKPGGRRRPERWCIYTFEKNDITFVKRVAARGGEAIRIAGGDVYIDGRLDRKSDEARRALRFPYAGWIFPETRGEAWRVFPAADGSREWVYAGSRMASIGPVPPTPEVSDVLLRDVYAELEIDRAAGETVSLVLDYLEPTHLGNRDVPVRLRLSAGDDRWTLAVVRDGEAQLLEEVTEPTPRAGRLTMGLSFVDGVLRWEGAGHVSHRDLDVPRGLVVRPGFGASGPASRPIRFGLDKDIHYSPAGEIAVGPDDADDPDAFLVPPGHVFFLGDNTHNSRDSRFRSLGIIPEADLIGPVHVRIWPPARIGAVR